MDKIIEFLKLCYNEYLDLIIAGVCLIAVIIFVCIVIYIDKKKSRKEKKIERFQEQSIEALTPEEIEKISNNSADPDSVKITLTQEVTDLKEEKAKKKNPPKQKAENKASDKKEQPKTKTTSKPKTEAKKKAETKAEEKPETKKPTKAKTEEKPKAEVKAKTEEKPETKKPTKVKTEEKPKAETKKKAEAKVEEKPKTETKKPTKAKTEEKPKAEAKPKAEKPTPVTVPTEEKKQFYTGKWKIKQDEQGFLAILTASNGGTLLKTEYYKSLSGVKNGIETIKKNIDSGNFAISIDKYGHYRFKLFTSTNRLICVSEDYSSKAKCESGIESVKRFAKTASVIREENDE